MQLQRQIFFDGALALIFIRRREFRYRGSALDWCTTAAIAVILYTGAAWCFATPKPELEAWGLLTALAVSFLLTAAVAIGHASAAISRERGLLILPLTLYVNLVELGATRFLDAFDNTIAAYYFGYGDIVMCIWLVVAIARATPDGRTYLRGFAAMLLIAGLIAAAFLTLPKTRMFYAATLDKPPVDVEAIYYQQPHILAEHLDRIRASEPGVADLYFVGFAGYANQDVFLREVRQAANIVAERFGDNSQSIILVNNPATLTSHPMANHHNLRRTLLAINEKIQADEDFVFLFVSSHGDEDGTVAVNFPGFKFNDISAAEIFTALHDAQIEWPITVISACYSGSFIPVLEHPKALIIAAAASDRQSFGCAHQNDWTYFGEAYFQHGLTLTRDPIEAFHLARERVEARETQERKTPSKPQISAGSEMVQKLNQWLLEAD
ncbi:MAG: C13 family peptidase [Pseudomonadota bacterium]